jgi:hypothetical protein
MSSKEQSTQSDLSSWAIVVVAVGIVVYTHQAEIIQAVAIILSIAFAALLIYGSIVLYRNRPKPLEPPSNKPLSPVSLEPLPAPKQAPKPELPATNTFAMHINYEERQEYLLDNFVHACTKLKFADHSFLIRRGYEEREYVPLGKIRREKFLIKKQPPKSFDHTFLLHAIYDALLDYGLDAEITRDQDIALLHKRQDYALCVVTPDDLRKHNYLSKKASRLTSICGGNWWFVVTTSAYAKSFQRYGNVLTRNQIDHWIHTTFNPKTP